MDYVTVSLNSMYIPHVTESEVKNVINSLKTGSAGWDVSHVYAESCLVFQLVKMKNCITINDILILRKLEEKTHSQSGFSKYVINAMLEKYSFDFVTVHCHTCGRT